MKYEIKGGSFPIVELTLNKGEKVVVETGAMAWRSHNLTMNATTNGGIGKVFGRLFSQESLFQNFFIAEEDNAKLCLGGSVPGSIMAIELRNGESIVCQKSSFLASYGDIEMSVFFNKKLGVGFFGGEGFIMQKMTGTGYVFIAIDGSSIEHELREGEQLVISTGHLVSMAETCTISIESVAGLKNKLFSGEGFFNTIVTGPGKVVTQTMPIAKLAHSVIPYIPRSNSNN